MRKEQVTVNALLLIGKDAIAIPCLAVVGAASVMGATIYGCYKLTGKLCDVISTKIEEQFKTES